MGDRVVVEPAQRLVRPGRAACPGLATDGESPAQAAAQRRERPSAVGEQDPEPWMAFEHPRHGDVRRRHGRLQRVAHRVPQVVAVQGGHAEATGGGVDEDQRARPLGLVPERAEEVVAQVPATDAGGDLHPAQPRDGDQFGELAPGQHRILQGHRAHRADPPGMGGGGHRERVVLYLADQACFAALRVHRHQVDPGGEQQVADPGRGRLGEHGGDVGELARHRVDLAAAETQPVTPVLPAHDRAPVIRHRASGHLGDDDVAVGVDDQRLAPGAAPFAAAAPGPSAGSPPAALPAPGATAPPR